MFRGDLEFDQAKPKSTMDETHRGEKKRQQSRSAAKSRRSTESEIFAQLIDTLPTIDQPTIYQMDRIGALRLAWTLCRIRRVGEKFFSAENENESSSRLVKSISRDLATQPSMDACVEGFLMVVNKIGQLLYVTPCVAESIGFTQIDLVGRYLRDYVHSDDWSELKEHLCTVGGVRSRSDPTEADIAAKTFFRMKTALTPRGGRARKLTMAVYQPLQAFIVKPSSLRNELPPFVEGMADDESTHNNNTISESDDEIRLMHCIPFTLTSSRRPSAELLPAITSRHDMDMRFRICDEIFAHTLGYKNAKAFIGRSFYELVHPDDVPSVVRDIQSMYRKSHGRTGYYRLLNRLGESIWASSEMLLLVQNVRGSSQKSVVCTHQILSESQPVLMDLPRPIVPNRLQPIIEEFDGEEEDDDDDAPGLLDETESLPPLTTMAVKRGTNPLGPAKIANRQQPEWARGSTRLRPSEEHSESLAPYIAHDTQMLTPLADPDDMPGLMPAYWDNWLSGNPILHEAASPDKECPSMNAEQQQSIFENGQCSSNEILPLDFADIFGMNIVEDTNPFSIDEFDRAFSQIDQSPINTPQISVSPVSSPINAASHSDWLSTTPTTTAVHSDWLPPPPCDFAAVPVQNERQPTDLARKQSLSMYGKKPTTAILTSPPGTSKSIGQSMDGSIFFDDELGDDPMFSPATDFNHHYTRAEEKQIDNIEKELFLETQRFLV